ncbi:MAG: cyclopropane-fatty-acyl-phospholipid synthase family protein [Terracidiphilus sp.]
MGHSAQSETNDTIDHIFQGYEGPAFAIRLWDGWQWSSRTSEKPACTLVVENPKALASLVAKPNEITLGEAFIHGDLEVEGDIFSIFAVVEHLLNRPRRLRRQIMERLAGALFGLGQRMRHGSVNSRRRDRASIAYHYDQPVAFFEPWLGQSLVYSCAYFHTAEDSLDRAQAQKLELICRKLRLQPGERFLDIGCGWGSLLLHAAGARQAQAEGITLSREQAETAKRRIAQSGLNGHCCAEWRDYRELDGRQERFDKIASVGMFEHVGLKNLPEYFGAAYRLLKPGGLFLNHGIARSPLSPLRQSSFIDRFVFPDGRLVTLAQALNAAESQGLEVRDVENLREHYEMTMRRWVEGLRRNVDALLEHVPMATYRTWLLYMAGSAAAFRRGNIGVYQVLLSRPDKGNSRLPLTRDDLYAASACGEEEEEVGV